MPSGICPERTALVEAFTKAVSDYNRLHSAQVAALVRGSDLKFDMEMQSARKAVDLARAAILLHEREHGCDVLTTAAGS
jgi:hypothetical protein